MLDYIQLKRDRRKFLALTGLTLQGSKLSCPPLSRPIANGIRPRRL